MARKQIDPGTGLLLGLAGGVAGMAAMTAYFKIADALGSRREKERGKQSDGDRGSGDERSHEGDVVSPLGKNYREGESSTAAAGRVIYHAVTGRDPDEQTKTVLGHVIHHAFGVVMGAFYGAVRSGESWKGAVPAGLLYGTGIWLLGDEVAVPMLGLQGGPRSVPVGQHLNRLGAHLAYGLATSSATKLLARAV